MKHPCNIEVFKKNSHHLSHEKPFTRFDNESKFEDISKKQYVGNIFVPNP